MSGLINDQEELNALLKEEEDLKKKIADFNRDEARRLEDDLREERKKRDDIAKIRADADEKERDAIFDYNLDRERAEQDHQKRLTEIVANASVAFDDAISARDSSAAQAAEKQLTEQKRAENEQFKLDQKRAAEDFAIDQARAQRERDQRIAEANVELQDLIDKNARERARRLEDYNIEMAELQAKIDQERLVQQTANANEVAAETQHQQNLATIFSNGIRLINNAVAGGLPGVASLFTSFFQQMTNSFNASLAASAAQANAQFQARQTGTAPPPRAQGGDVLGNKLYEIMDGQFPELLRQGNKSYLLPNKNGDITPIKPVQPQRALAGAGGMNIELNIGGININGASGNFEQLAATIERRIMESTVGELSKQLNSKRKV